MPIDLSGKTTITLSDGTKLWADDRIAQIVPSLIAAGIECWVPTGTQRKTTWLLISRGKNFGTIQCGDFGHGWSVNFKIRPNITLGSSLMVTHCADDWGRIGDPKATVKACLDATGDHYVNFATGGCAIPNGGRGTGYPVIQVTGADIVTQD